MCNWVAAAQATMQVAGDYLGQKSQANSYQKMMQAQARGAVREMNYAFQNYEQERTDAYDAAVAEITKTRLNAMTLNSQVEAAVNEDMSGRTANLLIKSTEGDTARTVASMQDNYDRKSNEVDLNKETKMLSTEDYLKNLNASAPKMPSRFTNLVGTAAVGLNAYTMARNQITKEKAGGKNGGKG